MSKVLLGGREEEEGEEEDEAEGMEEDTGAFNF